jgi:type IV pilus assembly protein PilE
MTHSGMRARARGFTLVELMVVVLIVAVLSAIAIPSYTRHVAKTNRSAAKACLSEAAQFMERYYTTNLTYEDATLSLGCQTDSKLDERYTLALSDLDQKTYTVTATPVGVQANRDVRCGTLSVDQDGKRNATGTGGVQSCW